MIPAGKALRLFSSFLATTLLTFYTVFSLPANAQAAKALFLPLKVKSFQNTASYKKIIDKNFRQNLISTDTIFPDRTQAEAMVDYTGETWPPSVEQLKQLAQENDVENVITGLVTTVGREISIDIQFFDILAPQNPVYFYQKARSGSELPTVIKQIAESVKQYNNRQFRIAAITTKGNNRIDSGAILRKISTQRGSVYNQAALREDLKEIYKMGYFNNVQIDVADGTNGKEVTFLVEEKPVIQSVEFLGISQLKEEDVKAVANIRDNLILNPVQIDKAKKAILTLYKSKGFYDSIVKVVTTYPNDEGAVVKFIINEGKKIYIKEIKIEGNEAFSDSKILDQIQTGERWFMSWLTEAGLLDQTKIAQDTKLIQAFYSDNGYLDVRVDNPVIEQKGEWLYITFKIDEGPRYKVGKVEIAGSGKDDRQQLLGILKTPEEEYISRKVIRSDILKLTDHYAEQGYAFADIKPSFQKVGNDKMNILFNIDKGNLVYVDRIIIRGNTRTHDNVIRRELRIEEGGIFDSKALRLSSQALQRLQFFEEVSITPEPAMDPNRMTIIISVKERSTGSFSIGAGYSSADKLLFMGKIAENNFLGRGDSLSLSANIGGSSTYFNLAYTNPRLNDSQLSWGLDAFHTSREYDDYTRKSSGGGLRIGYPIWEKWKIYGNYSLTSTDLTDVQDTASYIIRNSVNIHLTSAIKLSLVRDTRNLRFGATKGSRNVLSVKYAGGPLGGDAQFTKVEGTSGWYIPLFWGTSFHIKLAAGKVFENETDKLPVYERFYLGGLSSVRGFKYARISPIDPVSGERVGGDKMWFSNLEYIFPLLKTQGVNGLLFFDAGQVSADDMELISIGDDLKKAAGIGLNWLSPMGPLKFVLGYNLDPADNEDDSVFDFSIGGSF